MTKTLITRADLVPNRPPELAKAMLDVILGFARLDTALTARLSQALGMPLDRGSLLVENMDIAVKMTRLKKVSTHDGDIAGAEFWGKAKKIYDTHKDIRNTIAHATYVGTRKTHPDTGFLACPCRYRRGGSATSLSDPDVPNGHYSEMDCVNRRSCDQGLEQHDGPVERLGE